jgi:hypothetical protein
MKFVLLPLIAIAISGCAGVKNFTGPTGELMYVVKCKYDESQCFNDAAKTCNGPYQVKSSSRGTGGILADALPGPVAWYKMTYVCGAADGVMPQFQSDGRPTVIPVMPMVPVTPAPAIQQPRQIECRTSGKVTNCNMQ